MVWLSMKQLSLKTLDKLWPFKVVVLPTTMNKTHTIRLNIITRKKIIQNLTKRFALNFVLVEKIAGNNVVVVWHNYYMKVSKKRYPLNQLTFKTVSSTDTYNYHIHLIWHLVDRCLIMTLAIIPHLLIFVQTVRLQ